MSKRFFWLVCTAALLLAPAAEAHKKWFIDARPYPTSWAQFWQPLPLATTAAVLLAAAGAAWLQRRRGGRGFLPGPAAFHGEPDRLSKLYALMPLVLAAHVAVPLLVNGMAMRLFSPNTTLPLSALGMLELTVAIALFYGGFTRLAAVVLALLWGVGGVIGGPEAVLENAHYLGVAAFFYLAGRGPISVDRLVLPSLEPTPEQMALAVRFLRIGTGLSLIVVAFSEKLANLPLAMAFLEKYPLNFVRASGVPLPDELFLAGAGGTELLMGVFLVLNIFPREVAAVAWLFFNLTLTVFDATELVNHLPFFGVFVLLLAWMPGVRTKELWVAGLRESFLPIRPPLGSERGYVIPPDARPDPAPALGVEADRAR